MNELEYLADVLLYTGETWPLNFLDAIGRPQPGLRYFVLLSYSVLQNIKSMSLDLLVANGRPQPGLRYSVL